MIKQRSAVRVAHTPGTARVKRHHDSAAPHVGRFARSSQTSVDEQSTALVQLTSWIRKLRPTGRAPSVLH
jgi:hypothetical protein